MPLPVSALHRGANETTPVTPGHGSDRLTHHHRGVGGGHGFARRDRELELAVGVLGVELLQLETLRLDRLTRSQANPWFATSAMSL